MSLTQEELREIYDECGGDVSRIAARLGVSFADYPAAITPPNPGRRRSPPRDIGHRQKDGWPDPKYIVSIRHCDGAWPSEDQDKIDKARADYEAGSHEMCQGRDRGWFVLFSIPRKKRCGARKFFQMEGA